MLLDFRKSGTFVGRSLFRSFDLLLKNAVKDEEHWSNDTEMETPTISRIADTM
jgi:hypothetical protein